MARVFVYDGREFPDPDSNLKVDDVRQNMANFFPELSNAESKESKRGEDTIIEFKKRVGVKGGSKQEEVRKLWRTIVALVQLPFTYPRAYDQYMRMVEEAKKSVTWR